MNIRTDEIGLKVVSALLLHYGELSMTDIRSLPFFVNPHESEAVIQFLLKRYDVEIYTKKVSSYPIPEWEEVIRLKESPRLS